MILPSKSADGEDIVWLSRDGIGFSAQPTLKRGGRPCECPHRPLRRPLKTVAGFNFKIVCKIILIRPLACITKKRPAGLASPPGGFRGRKAFHCGTAAAGRGTE
jgi:hypothetical protein